MIVGTMTRSEYAAAKQALLRGQHRAEFDAQHGREMKALRRRHPDLAAKADDAARARGRQLWTDLQAAAADMNEANAAVRDMSGHPSVELRARAKERLAAAVERHDVVLRAHEAAVAELNNQGMTR